MSTPTYARRRIGSELRKLRLLNGMSLDSVTEALGWNKSKLSRIETAKMPISKTDLQRLTALYRAEPDDEQRLLAWIPKDTREYQWWREYSEIISVNYADYISYEAHACDILIAHANLIPGLLQSEEYARAVINSGPFIPDPDIVEAFVEVRMKRQRLLDGPSPATVSAVIMESVFDIDYGGPEVMAGQLKLLISMMETSNIQIHVLPTARREVLVGGINIFTYPDPRDPKGVFLEHQGGMAFEERERSIRRYHRYVEHLRSRALDPEQTRKHLVARLDGS